MYRPPENSNRVKSIKSKFEKNFNDVPVVQSKPPLRKAKTVQELNVRPKIGTKNNVSQIKPTANSSSDTENALPILSRQFSDPAKRNIKRTPAFRLDKNTASDQKNTRLLQNRSRYLDNKISKFDNNIQECSNENVNFKEQLSRTKTNGYGHINKDSFSSIRSKFNGENVSIPVVSNAQDESKNSRENDQSVNTQSETENTEIVKNNILKFLYTEPIPKCQRKKKEDNIFYANDQQKPKENIHNSSTLKLTDKTLSDDESHYATKNFMKSNPTYGSLRSKKSLENLTELPNEFNTGLTDTLKNALKKPLPKGPAPKKPPRTFTHSPVNKNESPKLNLSKDFTNKLNSELQKNVTGDTTSKKSKGDAKYMLDKLETVLKSKGKLLRKSTKANSNTSEEDSDNEKNKLKFLNLRDLPAIPSSSAAASTQNFASNIFCSSPTSSTKFNLNCLTTLGCGTSAYEAVKEPNSSFFVSRKKEEPVYAEPFEYQVGIEERGKNSQDKDSGVDGSMEAAATNTKTIRRSLHYASSPVPDVKGENTNNHVSDVKNQDQVFNVAESTPSSSDMESVVSTPSEENKALASSIKVKDLIKAIESNNNRSAKNTLLKTNSSPSAIKHNNNENSIIINNSHSDDGIKKLETQLKTATDKSFSSTSALNVPHSDTEQNDDDGESKRETKKFVSYVKRVRSKVFSRTRRKKENLFHCCLLVALDRCTPYVKTKFPAYVQEPYKIAELCFPEVECGAMDHSVKAQCYSLIITNELGERTFGYCRRVLPEASTACLPLAYCILSKHRAPGFYRRILEELESRHGFPDKFRNAFLEGLYNCKFPMPGETIAIDCSKIISNAGCDQLGNNSGEYKKSVGHTNKNGIRANSDCDKDVVDITNGISDNGLEQTDHEDGELDLNSYIIVCNSGEYGTLINGNKNNSNLRGSTTIINIPKTETVSKLKRCSSSPSLPIDLEFLPSELVLMRPHDSRHEENDLKLLGETLKMPILQQVFCSLLLERKIILVSCVLSKLSSCIEALQIILYPFSWQHTIIPVLPRSLWEIVDAPTPLVCGVLSPEVVNDYTIENGIVVDLDEGAVLLQVGDEDRILPWCLTQTLKNGLDLASKETSNKSGAHNVFFSDAFLRVFIQSCGHYRNFIIDGELQKSGFIQFSKQKGKHIRQFLKWFTETTMFYSFKELAEGETNTLDLFDQRIKIYTSESATRILNKMKYWTNYKSLVSSNLSRFQ